MTQGLTVITGANGQIGSFLAHSYAQARKPLLLLYHQAKGRLAELENDPGLILLSCDLCDADAVKQALDTAVQTLSATPAYLIHTAAVRSSDAQTVADSDPHFFGTVLKQNIMAAYNILRFTLPFMRATSFGRVVLFGSNVVQTGLANGSAYAAAKAAIVNLAKSTALENASRNILVNCISPAPVETRLEEDYAGEYLAFRKDYFEQIRKSTPTGKLVSKAEIKSVIDLLLSASIDNLSGQNIVLDGGFSSIFGEKHENN